MRLALLVTLVATVAAAEEPRALALREVVAAAARQNPTLGMAVEDLAVAHGQQLSAAGLNDPIVDASGSWTELNEPATGPQPGTLDNLVLATGVTQPLPTGGAIGLHLDTGFTRTIGGPLPATAQNPSAKGVAGASTLWQPTLQLSISHSLLRGVGIAVARAPQRKTRFTVAAAASVRGATAAALVRDVTIAYWELYFAEHQVEIRRRSAQAARDMLEIVKANIGVGKQPSSASAEVEVAIANRESDAIDAEQEQYADAVELGRLRGDEPSQVTAPRLADEPPAAAPIPSLPEVLSVALMGNFDLLAARANLNAASVDVDVANNAKLPQLDAAFSGGPLGTGSAAGPAFSQMGRFGAYQLTASLVFTQPTVNRAARGLDASARAARRKADLNETSVRLLVQANAARALQAAANAARRMAVLQPMSDVAHLDLDAERARFTAGRSTNFDVLRRQDEVAQVELRRLRARVDYLQAMAIVHALTGEILPRMGVVLR